MTFAFLRKAIPGFSLALWLLLPIGALQAADVPDHVPDRIAAAWMAARHDWTMEAQLVHATFTRPDASQPFSSDIVFLAASRQKLYHIKDGTKGRSAGEESYRYAPALTGQIIDLPGAVATARTQGMKGNVVLAELTIWLPHNSSIATQVWRLVPDNDPNTQDPNDPNMKNYFVDAVTGAAYAASNPDNTALAKGRDAMNKALAADMMALVKIMQQRK